MTPPKAFRDGYASLPRLVKSINSGSLAEDKISQSINDWVKKSCGGTVTMAMSTIYALRAVLAERGPGATGEVRNSLLVLQDIERRLVGALEDPETSEIKEVPPNSVVAGEPTGKCYVIGECEIIVTNNPANGIGISVLHPARYPTTKELMRARTLSPDTKKNLFAYFPGEGKTFGLNGCVIILVEDPKKAGFL